VTRLQAIGGIGEKTARFLCAGLPRHFRHARAVAGWLGVVPRQVQSGTSVRQGAHIGHEAPDLRHQLYFPALTAVRHDPRCRIFAERLRAAGKPPKSIVLAVLHKLVRTAFALLKTGADYEREHHTGPALTSCSPWRRGFGNRGSPSTTRRRRLTLSSVFQHPV
jgi:transposase